MFSLTPFSYLSPLLRWLLLCNLSVFIGANVVMYFEIQPLYFLVNMLPYSHQAVVEEFQVWRAVTYMFTHFSIWHFVMNMLMLWMFGDEVVRRMGAKKFLWFYLGTGVFAALCSFQYHSVIGASGALFAVMYAYAWFFPERQILVFFVLPMPVKYAIYLFAFIDVMSIPAGGNIARFTHLGGFAAAIIYFKWIYPRLLHSGSARRFQQWRQAKNKEEYVAKKANEKQETFFEDDAKLDRILQKISRYGRDSLNQEESTYINEYSQKQQLRKGNVIDMSEWKKRNQ